MAAAEAVTVDAARMREEAPQLAALLKDMKNGLDELRTRIEALTAKVKADHFPTTHGITYLETKHLLLLNYCQSLVYYLLWKAKGLSIDGHPVVRSLVEIRLFLEKIRPIDKKLQFQLGKFTGVVGNFVEKNAVEKRPLTENEMEEAKEEDEWSKYRPNPDMLAPRKDATLEVGVYRPPKIAPAVMDEDKMSRQKRNALRKEEHAVRDARNSAYLRELMNDLEGRPEEVREDIGSESREISRYKEKLEAQAQQEEEHFIRAPRTKSEKKKMRHMKKPRNGLSDLTESFYDEIKTLPFGDSESKGSAGFGNGSGGERKHKKPKRRH